MTLMMICVAHSVAESEAYESLPLDCKPTPALISGVKYPGANKIMSSSKLAKPPGKAEFASGQLVFLSGRVLDEQCVPVAGAVVDLWQAGSDGEYHWPSEGDLLSPDPVFSSSGRTVTDNLGRYSFVTLFPGPHGNHAPLVNLRVMHQDFPMLETEMFFAGDRRNAEDAALRHFNEAQRALVMAEIGAVNPQNPETGLEARFNITLKGRNKYKRY